ncbi:MAG TPA: SDR family oxidoreductase [Trueperaceae bacterium]|nr:SDR family oxidoreductase [Trueperaceae bacterium]
MDLGLTGRRALVLAGTSGLGLGTVRVLASEGAAVVLCGRDADRAAAAAAEVSKATGGTVTGLQADVAAAAEVERLVAESAERLGGLDILVTNAGGPRPGSFEALDDDAWAGAVELTLMSVVRSVRAALPFLRRSPGGTVLALASSSVKAPIANLTLSNVLRPAVQALVKTLSLELAGDGIRVNCLSPGRVLTPRILQLDEARAEREGKSVDEVRQASVAGIPLGRLGDVEEFGRVAAFLVSDAASYMTGTSVLVDGGMVRCL